MTRNAARPARLAATLAAVLTIAGCGVVSSLPPEAEVRDNALRAASFDYPAARSDGVAAAQRCALDEVSNDAIRLVGGGQGETISGAPVLERVDRPGELIVVRATDTYSGMMTAPRAVRFALLIEPGPRRTLIRATNIREAVIDTGEDPNPGLRPVRAGMRGTAGSAFDVVEETADRLGACIART